MPAAKTDNLEGAKFTYLTVVERHGRRGGARTWRCICKCGSEVISTTNALRMKSVQSCGCLKREAYIRRRKFSSALNNMRCMATKRGYEWGLTESDAVALLRGNCHYCGKKPHMKTSTAELRNGIDRVDNTRGYFMDNVVSCCRLCNLAKRDLSYDDFVNLITAIYTNLSLQGPKQ